MADQAKDEPLRNFLQACNLEEYWEIFASHDILTNENLLAISADNLNELMPNPDHQTRFKNHWAEAFGILLDEPIEENNDINVRVDFNIHAVRSTLLLLITKTKVLSWIKNDQIGQSILDFYDRKKLFYDKQANDIVKIIIRELQKISDYWGNDHFDAIAQVLTGADGIFPGEVKGTYFVPSTKRSRDENGRVIKGQSSRGKLVNAWKNRKSEQKSNSGKVKRRKDNKKTPNPPDEKDEPADVQGSIRLVNGGNGSEDEFHTHWLTSSKYRHKFIKASAIEGIQWAFDKWPALKNVELAADLINVDFDQNFTAEKDALKYFEDHFKILKALQPSKHDDSVDLTEEIAMNVKSPKDQRLLAQLELLSNYFPPHGGVYIRQMQDNVAGSSRKRKRPLQETEGESQRIYNKFSVPDALNSIIQYVDITPEIGKLREAIEAKHKKKSLQPYIIAVGQSLVYAEQYVVVINDLLLLTKSVEEALDLCFKTFHVFDLKYPPESHHLWSLIEQGMYELKGKNYVPISGMCKAIQYLQNANTVRKEKE